MSCKHPKMLPFISIVLPFYNAEDFLAEAIESVLAQTYENWELLIVNDAATDGSDQIARAYAQKDKRIRYFVNEKNCGAGLSRNNAIERACGDYLMFLDADDFYQPDICQKVVHVIQNNSNQPDVILFPFEYLKGQERGCWLKRYPTGPLTLKEYDLLDSVVLWNAAWRMQFIKENQFVLSTASISQDHNFVIPALLKATHLFYLNEIGITYRIVSQSISHKKVSFEKQNLNDEIVFTQLERDLKRLNLHGGGGVDYKTIKAIIYSWKIEFDPLMDKTLFLRDKAFFIESGLTDRDFERWKHPESYRKFQKLLKHSYFYYWFKSFIRQKLHL